MKIDSLDFEIIRATPAVAELLVHVELDVPAVDCEVCGRAVGPRCPGVSTVEVSYPMTTSKVSDTSVSLRCVIPEPNLWTVEVPFTYVVIIDVRQGRDVVETRNGVVALRAAKGH